VSICFTLKCFTAAFYIKNWIYLA